MAITAALLTAYQDGTDASSYVTVASITPTANRLVLASVASAVTSGSPAVPTVTGNGLTWVQIGSAVSGPRRMTMFRAMGSSPSTGAVTIDFGGVTQLRCAIVVTEFATVDTSGTNGSGAVVQFKTSVGTGTAGNADFDNAFGDAVNNATYSAIYKNSTSNTVVDTSYTELAETVMETTAASLQVMWILGEDQTPVPTWTPSASFLQVVIEIKAGGASTQALTGSLFTKAPTFFTGVVTPGAVALTGSLFTKAPTFFTGVVTAQRTLSGVLFTKAPTFFTGTVTSVRALTGTLFQKAPTFLTGAVSLASSPQTVTGTLFTKAPTFFTGTVTATYPLTGTLFTKAPTFPTGAVTTGAVTLTGTLFTKAPTFPTGVVTAGAVNLTGVLFQKAPTFPTGIVTAGTVTLNGTLFVKAPTFPTGTIGQTGTIFGTLYVNTPVFFTGSFAQGGPSFWQPNPAGWTANPSAFVRVGRYGPSPWGAELSGQRFEKAPTFPVGTVS